MYPAGGCVVKPVIRKSECFRLQRRKGLTFERLHVISIKKKVFTPYHRKPRTCVRG
jgi:hypothetical protein